MVNFSIYFAIFSIMRFLTSWYVLFMVSLALIKWLLIFVILRFMSSYMTSCVCSVASWKQSSTAFSFMAISTEVAFHWFDVLILFLCFNVMFLFFFVSVIEPHMKVKSIGNIDCWIDLFVWFMDGAVGIGIIICGSINRSMFSEFLVGVVGSMGILNFLFWMGILHKFMIFGFVVMTVLFVTRALYFTLLWILVNVVFLFQTLSDLAITN